MKALIIDDERIARAELRRLLAAHSGIEIIGEARNGAEALALIQEARPDLLFLDIQMPGMTGFDLLEQLDDPPQIIFTTAFDRHALQAFDVNAVDYLLKPIAPARLAAALAKLREPAKAPTLSRVFVRDGERCWLVNVVNIQLLESEGNYTRLYFGADRPLVPRSLTQLEERLDPGLFFRASRRYLVNLQAIQKVEQGVADNLIILLAGGQTVEMSRRQSSRLREVLGL